MGNGEALGFRLAFNTSLSLDEEGSCWGFDTIHLGLRWAKVAPDHGAAWRTPAVPEGGWEGPRATFTTCISLPPVQGQF